MTIKKLYQLVEIPSNETAPDNLDYGSIASDCDTKTITILSAINFISLSLSSKYEEGSIDKKELANISCIISDLAEIGIATNKISTAAYYYSGCQDGRNGK